VEPPFAAANASDGTLAVASQDSAASSRDGCTEMSEPARVTMSVLGGIKVARGGKEFVLPASRKARSLLIYLAITERPHRRDRLCAMFWDMPDDPRGALATKRGSLGSSLGSHAS
jgi:hypothetical protein